MKYLTKLGATLTTFALSVSLAFAGGLPQIPSNPQWSDPAGIISTFNTWGQQLNGTFPNLMFPTAPAAGPSSIMSLGGFCTASGGTPQTCNAQRGNVGFTGVASLATGATATLVINNSLITAANVCQAWETTAGTAGSAVYAATVVTGTGTISVVVANGGTTTDAVTTHTLAFNCIQ